MNNVRVKGPTVIVERDEYRVGFNFEGNDNKIVDPCRYKDGVYWGVDPRDIPKPFLHVMRKQAYAVYRKVFYGISTKRKKKAAKTGGSQLTLKL